MLSSTSNIFTPSATPFVPSSASLLKGIENIKEFVPFKPTDSKLLNALPFTPFKPSQEVTFTPVNASYTMNSYFVPITEQVCKSQLCRDFMEAGFCRYGMNCQYAHGLDELVTFNYNYDQNDVQQLTDKYKS